MVDTKISELTEKATPVAGDFIAIVDIAGGTVSKKAQIGNLPGGNPFDQDLNTTDSPSFAGLIVDTNVLFVDSTNNRAGIGTITPGAMLEVNSDETLSFSVKSTTNPFSMSVFDSNISANGDIQFYRNLAAASTSGPIVQIEQDNATDDQPALRIQQDASVNHISLTGAGSGIDMSTSDIQNLQVAEFAAEFDNGNSGASKTIDWNSGNNQKVNLDQNTTLSFTAPSGPAHLLLRITGGASFTITWPTITWLTSGGTAPTLDGTDIVVIWYNGTTYYGAILNQS